MDSPWFSRFFERSRESLRGISVSDFVDLVRPKCKQIVTDDELVKLLSSKKIINVKLGVDTTGGELHLGHAVPLMLLRLFQRRGHTVQFIIGDFTGKIGDPSGRTDKRVELSDADVKKNMKTYVKQITSVIDIKKAKVFKNSQWLSKMKLNDFFKIIGAISFSDIAQREDFRNRIKAGAGVTLREANYAALMAIDSLHLKSDIEVCGIDQLLNVMQARSVMSASGLIPEVVLATPLIEGTAGDGRKMSKSFKNYIALSASAETQFGLIMSIPDALLSSYFVSFADIYSRELNDLQKYINEHPYEAKQELGMLIVGIIHGEKIARATQKEFERRFSRREYMEADESRIEINLPINIVEGIFEALGGELSKSRIRGLIGQSGIRRIVGADQHVINSTTEKIHNNDLIKVGKMNLLRFLQK
jgi:tyrosyl-tRNA synthetase